MRRFVFTVAVLLAFPALPVSADDGAPVKFVNNMPVTARLYIDGQASCAAAPGEYCNDVTSVGTHTFYAQYEDPNYQPSTACESQQVNVPPDGFTWTCGG